jgi:hypothetical protein
MDVREPGKRSPGAADEILRSLNDFGIYGFCFGWKSFALETAAVRPHLGVKNFGIRHIKYLLVGDSGSLKGCNEKSREEPVWEPLKNPIDARLLAHFTKAIHPPVRLLPDEQTRELAEWVQRRPSDNSNQPLIDFSSLA